LYLLTTKKKFMIVTTVNSLQIVVSWCKVKV